MAKKKELTLEEKEHIQNYAVGTDGKANRTVEQMASVLTRPIEMVQQFVDTLYPSLRKKTEEAKQEATLMQQMLTPRPGITVMTQSAAEVSDDVAQRNKKTTSRLQKNCIHRPKG